MRLGFHSSTAGSIEKAAIRAAEAGANTLQIFSASPRMWRACAPDPAKVKLLQAVRDVNDLRPLVIHDSYLINLASSNPALHAQSVAAFRAEIERATAIGAEYLVMHPGNNRGYTIEEGIFSIIRGLADATRRLKRGKLEILLENTAGGTNSIGSKFEELAVIRQLSADQTCIPVNYCLDTAHCLASGYDIASADGLKQMVRTADAILDLTNVKVIHTNDSKIPLGGRLDRHQHIGQGYIGLDGFRRILNHPKLRSKAFILETPVDEECDERKNLDTLKTLCRKSSTTIKKLI